MRIFVSFPTRRSGTQKPFSYLTLKPFSYLLTIVDIWCSKVTRSILSISRGIIIMIFGTTSISGQYQIMHCLVMRRVLFSGVHERCNSHWPLALSKSADLSRWLFAGLRSVHGCYWLMNHLLWMKIHGVDKSRFSCSSSSWIPYTCTLDKGVIPSKYCFRRGDSSQWLRMLWVDIWGEHCRSIIWSRWQSLSHDSIFESSAPLMFIQDWYAFIYWGVNCCFWTESFQGPNFNFVTILDVLKERIYRGQVRFRTLYHSRECILFEIELIPTYFTRLWALVALRGLVAGLLGLFIGCSPLQTNKKAEINELHTMDLGEVTYKGSSPHLGLTRTSLGPS